MKLAHQIGISSQFEIPPLRDQHEEYSVGLDKSSDLMRERQGLVKIRAELKTRIEAIDAELLRRMDFADAKELADGDLVAHREKRSDSAKIERDWLLELFDRLTTGELGFLLPSNVPVTLRGWKLLCDRGWKPERHGERKEGGQYVEIKPRK